MEGSLNFHASTQGEGFRAAKWRGARCYTRPAFGDEKTEVGFRAFVVDASRQRLQRNIGSKLLEFDESSYFQVGDACRSGRVHGPRTGRLHFPRTRRVRREVGQGVSLEA